MFLNSGLGIIKSGEKGRQKKQNPKTFAYGGTYELMNE